MAKRSGRGKTPDNVVKLLKDAVENSSQLDMSKALCVGVASINRYINGIGEPTQETLEKLADYFEVSVAWLRGEPEERPDIWIKEYEGEEYLAILKDLIELYSVTPKHLRETVAKIIWGVQDDAEDHLLLNGGDMDKDTVEGIKWFLVEADKITGFNQSCKGVDSHIATDHPPK
ncbi:MAG: helix-turn-helix domain-containing protein [Desulfuromonadaceae bacterium]